MKLFLSNVYSKRPKHWKLILYVDFKECTACSPLKRECNSRFCWKLFNTPPSIRQKPIQFVS